LKTYLVKLAVSHKIVRQKDNSSKSFSKKLMELDFSNYVFGPKKLIQKALSPNIHISFFTWSNR